MKSVGFVQNWAELVRERFVAILREHGHEDVGYNFHLGTIRCGHFNKHVPGIQCNLGMVTIDDRRQRTDRPVGVQDHGVDWRVLDDAQIFPKVSVVLHPLSQYTGSRLIKRAHSAAHLVELHQFLPVHDFLLVQWGENNLLR